MQPNQQSTPPRQPTPQPTQTVKVPSPSPQPPAPPLQKPQRNNLLIAGLVATFLALAGTAGFFGYKYFQTQPSQPTPTPLSSAAPAKENDLMANWKTYTDDSYGFKFKYPPDWGTFPNTTEDGYHYVVAAPQKTIDYLKQVNGAVGGGKFQVFVVSISNMQSNFKNDEEWRIVQTETITIGDKNATKYAVDVIQAVPGLSRGDKIVQLEIPYNNKYIKIDLLDQSYTSIYDLILSTFQFLD